MNDSWKFNEYLSKITFLLLTVLCLRLGILFIKMFEYEIICNSVKKQFETPLHQVNIVRNRRKTIIRFTTSRLGMDGTG